jgi:aspartyl-tRNA(Asn)/glutamyl-tRNA(Gln) amidotransferase subunit A
MSTKKNFSFHLTSFSAWREFIQAEDPAEWIPQLAEKWNSLKIGPGSPALAWTADEDRIRQHYLGKAEEKTFAGIPCWLKDLFDLRGTRTLAGARLREKVAPAEEDCLLAKKLQEAGFFIGAKTHLHEFAYGLSGENPHYGDCPHPTLEDALSGGSSSGSAWGVGAGWTPFAIGTDTGGSIRVPAAFCGLFGYRKAPDDWCQKGVFPLAPSYDTAGWFTNYSEDMTEVLEALLENGNFSNRSGGVWFPGWGMDDDELEKAFQSHIDKLGAAAPSKWLRRLHRELENSGLPYSVLQSTEAFDIHRNDLDRYKAGYDPEVWGRIDRGRHWSHQQKESARDHERRVKDTLGELLEEVGFLIMPAIPVRTPRRQDFTLALREKLLAYTSPGSLMGAPTLIIPVRLGDGRSSGLQILFASDTANGPATLLQRLRE